MAIYEFNRLIQGGIISRDNGAKGYSGRQNSKSPKKGPFEDHTLRDFEFLIFGRLRVRFQSLARFLGSFEADASIF